MKTIFAFILILGFAGIAIFGVFAMAHIGGHSLCFATLAGGAGMPCPQIDPFGFANFHINIFKAFALAILTNSLSTLIAVALTLLFFAVAVWQLNPALITNSVAIRAFSSANRSNPLKLKLIHWVALHENSPSL